MPDKRGDSVINPLGDAGGAAAPAYPPSGRGLRGRLRAAVPPRIWWMRSVNLFREPMFIEDAHRVQVGFWKTVAFLVLLASSLLVYGLVVLNQQSTVSGTLYFQADTRPTQGTSGTEEIVICDPQDSPFTCYRKHILGLDNSPDVEPKLSVNCLCSSSDPVRIGTSVSLSVPRAVDMKHNVFRSIFGIVSPGQAFGDASPPASSPTALRCRTADQSLQLPDDAPKAKHCMQAVGRLLYGYGQSLFFLWSAVQPRVQSTSLGLTLLTEGQFEAAVQSSVQTAAIAYLLQGNSFQQTLSLSTSLFNPIPIPYADDWLQTASDLCYVPGTVSPPGCNCSNALQRGQCTHEARFDPYHLHRDLFSNETYPAEFPDAPFRVGCPDQQSFIRSLPQYMFKYAPLYGPEMLDCPAGVELYTSFTELNASVAAQYGLDLSSRRALLGDSAGLPSQAVNGPVVQRLDFFSTDGSNAIQLNPDFFTPNYKHYFDTCSPASCTYLVRRSPKPTAAVFMALAVLGSFQVLISALVNQVGDWVDSWLNVDGNRERVSNVFSSLEGTSLLSRRMFARSGGQDDEEEPVGPQVIRHRTHTTPLEKE